MVSYTIRSWTVCGLTGAFIDLALAYFLLCGSTFAFFASKFCNLFGLCLPCPCTGFFGYQSDNICWHRLLIDWPRRKIFSVQMLIKSKFPFDLILFDHRPCNLNMVLSSNGKYDHRVLQLDNEASSSSFSNPKLRNLVDRESGYDAKGKKVVNQKQRYGTRRSRRSTLGYGKSSITHSIVADASSSTYNGSDIKSQISGKEDGLRDEGKAADGLDLGERTWDSFEQSGLFGKNKFKDNDSSFVEKFICGGAQENSRIAGNEENVERMLEEALREEKAACSALQSELEKERAASATATDEAMAMILRLQADKAAVEMEARQYQRMIEEHFAYEEDEMNILKEILVRKERENHFLVKEVEAYRQMKCLGTVRSEVDLSYMTSELGQKPLHSPKEDPLVLQEIEKSKSNGRNANWPITYEASFTEVTSEAVQTCSRIEEVRSCCGDNIVKDRERKTELRNTLRASLLDSEPIIYDVHVIDYKTELREENSKESGLFNYTVTDFGLSSGELVSDCSSTSIAQSNQNNHGNSFEMKNGVPELGNSRSKTLLPDSAKSSLSAAVIERLMIDTEVELLRERLRIVQEGKEKLSFSAEQRESINVQLKVVEDMLNQLQENQELREPVGQASLPPSSSKVAL